RAVPLRCGRTVCAPLPSPTAVGERGGGGGPRRGRTLWTPPEAQPAQPTSPLQVQGPSPLRLRAVHALPSSPSAQLGPRGPGHSRHRTCHHWVGLVDRLKPGEASPQARVTQVLSCRRYSSLQGSGRYKPPLPAGNRWLSSSSSLYPSQY
ncbi:unnamed protein product, partial [Gulo gulo]